LFAYNDEPHRFSPAEVDILIAAIDNLKALDPAVGSGAFPMGILHKLVFILGKLDPRNEKWKERQIQRVRDAMTTAERIEDATIHENSLGELEQQVANIKEAFEHNELDYGRKLYLIENCIYGVDTQVVGGGEAAEQDKSKGVVPASRIVAERPVTCQRHHPRPMARAC
jgi:hypothetical protein